LNLFSTSADVPQKQIDPARFPSFPKEAPLSPGGASAFPAFPVEKQAPVIVLRTSGRLLEILREPNGVFSTRCNAMFRTLDHHVAYSNLPMKFPKGAINARQQAPKNVLLTILIAPLNAWKNKDGPILYLHHHCKHRAGPGHGLPCYADPAPMRRSHDSGSGFIHGGLATLWSRHLSS